jgi:hypothetical protein
MTAFFPWPARKILGNFIDQSFGEILPPITRKKLPFHKRDTFHILKTGNILSLNGTKNMVLIPSHHRYFTVPGRFGQKKSRNLVNFFYSVLLVVYGF